MSLPNSVLESRVIITALGPSIVCLGKPNPATANFNSSLLKLLSASWLAESAVRGRERWEMGQREVLEERRQKGDREARCMKGREAIFLPPENDCWITSLLHPYV